MEYGKKDWQRSDGRYRSMGKEEKSANKPLSAYHPADRENTRERRPNEMMTLESAYGGISFGANRRREMTMVVHEKRRSQGPGLKKDNRELEGGHTASLSELRGDFCTNSHDRRESALSYREELAESPLRMMERLREMMDENEQESGKKVLPFLNRRQEEAQKREIQEKLRESLEQGDNVGYQLWTKMQETFLQEKSEKETMYRQFYRELQFAREKAQKLMHGEGNSLLVQRSPALQETEGGQEDGQEGEPQKNGSDENLKTRQASKTKTAKKTKSP